MILNVDGVEYDIYKRVIAGNKVKVIIDGHPEFMSTVSLTELARKQMINNQNKLVRTSPGNSINTTAVYGYNQKIWIDSSDAIALDKIIDTKFCYNIADVRNYIELKFGGATLESIESRLRVNEDELYIGYQPIEKISAIISKLTDALKFVIINNNDNIIYRTDNFNDVLDKCDELLEAKVSLPFCRGEILNNKLMRIDHEYSLGGHRALVKTLNYNEDLVR